MSETILVAMSGGVDSSMTAALLLEAGHTLYGATMKLYCGEKDENVCGSSKDAADAALMAAHFGFPHEILEYTEAFNEQVIRRFAEGYAKGETPNPCIECNRYMKFSLLWERAKEMGCDAIATGHYARVTKVGERFALQKPLDVSKDQTYVLYHLTQEQLAHIRFPLGDYYKTQVREMAKERGLVSATKPDSQDICFVPDGDYAAFLERHTGKTVPAGDFVDTDGNRIGTHKGHIHYTVGQRKGLGVSFGQPMFVLSKDAEKNEVVLGTKDQLPCTALVADDLNWMAFDRLEQPIRVMAKTRYHQPETPATVYPAENGIRVEFDTPKVAAPGQAVVFYDGDIVLGGGTIRALIRGEEG